MTAIEDQARSVFLDALERAPDQWASFLAEACGDNVELRARVDRLLHAHRAMGSIHERDHEKLDATREPPIAERPGSVVGPYKLLESIGEGGFGVVFMAEQLEPIRRKVALKVIKPGMDTRQVIARFEAERQALAILDHPNIAKVLDAGTTDSGRPYFVMELVKGLPITDYCDQAKLTPRQRLGLFVSVCHAVQHAHQKGIIHRDLKPSNLLVTVPDGQPSIKVIDFGIAKAISGQLTDKTLFNGFAQLMGTPLYMSPEQAGLSVDIDTRSDIYSLGVLLYELLTGTTPFDKDRFQTAAYDEIRRIIREDEPPKPSTRLSDSKGSLPSISAQRQTEPAKLTRLVSGDLDWITMKALEKDRGRRYETANGFAADVLRYLAGEPVNAHPPSRAYRLKKFLRKNKGPVIAVAAIAASLLVGMVGFAWQARIAQHERGVAQTERDGAIVAREAEAEQRKEAVGANQLAFEALRSFTDDLMEKQFASKTELSENEKSMLRNALKQWEVFAQSKGDSPEARSIQAEGAKRVAEVQLKLGLIAEAESNCRMAVAIVDKLALDYPAVPKYRAELANNQNNLGILLADIEKRVEAEAHYRKSLLIRQKLVADFPTEPEYRSALASSHGNLGNLQAVLGNLAGAEEQHGMALAIMDKLVADYPALPEYRSNLASDHNNLGIVLERIGKGAGAEEHYRKAVSIRAQLVAAFPAVVQYRSELAVSHSNLGTLLAYLGKQTEAQEHKRRAVAIQAKLVADFPAFPEYRSGLSNSQDNLGGMLAHVGNPAEAEEQYRKALANAEKLAAEFPAVPKYRSGLATSRFNLGKVFEALGNEEAAEKQFRHGLAIQETLAAEFSAVPGYRFSLAKFHGLLGVLLANLAKPAQAEEQYEKAMVILERLAAEFPFEPRYRVDLAANHGNVVALLAQLGKLDEAWVENQASHNFLKKLVEQFPAVPDYRHKLATSHKNQGSLLRLLGKHADAQAQYHTGRDILKQLIEQFPDVPQYQRDLANNHNNQAVLFANLNKWAESEEQGRKAIAIGEKLAAEFPAVPGIQVELGGSYCDFASRLRSCGKPTDSLVWFDKAIRTLAAVYDQDPRLMEAKLFLRNSHFNRARAYDQLQKFADAVKDWKRTIELSPPAEQPGFRAIRATSLLQAGMVAEAVADVAELTKSSTWNAAQWYDFACVYAVASGKIADKKLEYADRAMELLQKAVKAGYKDAAHMAKDTDLDPLREREDFKKLMVEMEKKPAAQPEKKP